MNMPLKFNKRELIKNTSEVLSVLDDPPHFIQGNEGRFRFFNRGGYSIGLRDHAIDTFEESIKMISDFPDYIDISEKKIEDEYVQSLINILCSNSYTEETIKGEINRCLKELEESIEKHRVLVPIESLKLEGISELQIGNVRFIEYDSIQEMEMSRLHEIIDNNPAIPEVQKQFEKIELEKISTESFANRVCADITVISEVEKSYAKALYEVDNAVNLLRCYIPLLFSQGDKVQIGIYGDHNNISAGFRSLLSIKQNGGFHCSMERFGPLEPYKMTLEKLRHLKDNCYLELLGAILAKDTDLRNDLEKRIINAIRWIGTGIQNGNDCDKLLMFIIAIECLLINRNDEGKSSPIAERCAFLLSDLPDRRKKIDKKIRDLYDTRSEIVHEGLTEITAEEVGLAQWMAVSCLFAICKRLNNWQSLDQLTRWIKEQRYGTDNKSIDV